MKGNHTAKEKRISWTLKEFEPECRWRKEKKTSEIEEKYVKGEEGDRGRVAAFRIRRGG